MQKKSFKILGIFLIVVGVIFLFNFFRITGLAIFENTAGTTGSILGIIFVIGGVLLLNASQRTIHDELSDIVDNYNHEKISPVRAAIQTREALHKQGREISGVKYKGSERSVTVITPQGGYTLSANNNERAAELALGVYEVAITNDPKNERYCELHLGKGASTKHYRKGFMREEEKFRTRYANDVSSLRR